MYDEVDEEQYESIVRGRLQRDDFIEDDGVEGYADNGMDDWGGNQQSESEEEAQVSKERCTFNDTCIWLEKCQGARLVINGGYPVVKYFKVHPACLPQ